MPDTNRGRAPIITFAADKGGVGKTTESFEVAAALGAVLVDLDHHRGGATRMWGMHPERYKRVPLLEAFEKAAHTGTSKAPRLRTGKGKPDLVASHPILRANEDITDDLVADCLLDWAAQWEHPYVVVDTQPGDNLMAMGGVAAADIIMVPVPLKNRELDALEGMVEMYDNRVLTVVPTMVPSPTPRRMFQWLKDICDAHPGVIRVAPPISEHSVIPRRMIRRAISTQENPGVRIAKAQAEFITLARYIQQALIEDAQMTEEARVA